MCIIEAKIDIKKYSSLAESLVQIVFLPVFKKRNKATFNDISSMIQTFINLIFAERNFLSSFFG